MTRGALGVGCAAGACLLIGLILLCIACHCQNQKRQDKKHDQFMLQQERSEERQVKAEAKAKAKEEAKLAKAEQQEAEMAAYSVGAGGFGAESAAAGGYIGVTPSMAGVSGSSQLPATYVTGDGAAMAGGMAQPQSYAYTTQTYSTAPVATTYSTQY